MTDENNNNTPDGKPGEEPKFRFDKMHRVMRRRMPTLELIHERFARTVRLALLPAAPAPTKTARQSTRERPVILAAFIRPARQTTAVPCWSS